MFSGIRHGAVVAGVIVTAIAVAAAGSTYALGRSSVQSLDANLHSLISADYSVDPTGQQVAPLDERIAEVARSDETSLTQPRTVGQAAPIVPVARVDTGTGGNPPLGPTATPAPAVTPVPTPSVSRVLTPKPTPTPQPITPTPAPVLPPTSEPTLPPAHNPTSTPVATPTVTSVPTDSPSATSTPDVSATATATPGPSSTALPVPTATPTATPGSATPTATPTATPKPSVTPTPKVTPTATPTSSPTVAPTPTPTATAAPVPGTPVPGNALHIAAGQAHECVITAPGAVQCWGQNDRGQLGNGTTNQSSVPVLASLAGSATVIGAGAKHTCAVVPGTGVECWGNNNRGQLGDGTKVNRSSAVSVATLGSDVVELAGGAEHTCALLADGSVWCWGRNDAGQLGTGTKVDSLTPVPVLLVGTVTSIAAGDKFTCAAVTGVGVECWGQNSSGQLGNGTKTDHSLPALATGTGLPVQSLAAGQAHTCASFNDGSMKCWGKNSNGQLGNGTTADSLTPVPALATSVQSVTAGQDFTCVTVASDAVECWGNNSQGQLDDDDSHGDSPVPVLVTPLPAGVMEIRSGQGHTCSLHNNGAVYCWGQNTHGQLGNGGNTASGTPVRVVGLP